MKKLMKATAAIMLFASVVFATGCTPENDSTNQEGNNNGGDDNEAVTVITYTPEDITSTTAVCGGTVTVTEGVTLNEVGVCWGTNTTPTVAGTHLSTESVKEHFTFTLEGLEPNAKYYVCAYAMQGQRCYYGSINSFTTLAGGGGLNGHAYVDLGLPSGTLWATCNVGANVPEEYGDYFAWGETTPKTTYNWSTYKYCNGGYDQLTKYCYDADYGYNGFTDNLTVLQSSDDAATVNWGNGWCMPTHEQWRELIDNTNCIWTTQNGVNGKLFTASNGNSLFLPAVGYRWDDELNYADNNGYYWSSSLETYPYYAWCFGFYLSRFSMYGGYRSGGLSVRPVRSAR